MPCTAATWQLSGAQLICPSRQRDSRELGGGCYIQSQQMPAFSCAFIPRHRCTAQVRPVHRARQGMHEGRCCKQQQPITLLFNASTPQCFFSQPTFATPKKNHKKQTQVANGISWHCIDANRIHSHRMTSCSALHLTSLSLSPHPTSNFPSLSSEVSCSGVFFSSFPWPSFWLLCL